jgi:hypothetical protein
MVVLRVALTSLLLLGACSVGEVPIGGGGPDGGGGMGAATFESMIKPLVAECVGCHVGQPPNLTSFDALQPKYKMGPGNMNVFVTKGDISVPVGMHQGLPYLTEAEEVTVAAWIDSL